MERHSANGLALARFLAARPEVRRVHYPGLPTHPQHALAARLFADGFGGMLAFELSGGAPAVARFFAALRGIAFAPSFGDVTTTWTYPARTSHRPLSVDEQAKLGIDPGLVRLSVGVEALDDLVDELAAALGAAGT
jgi:cystathionine beta-lyase/cystathionine gamma-synthase